MGREGVPEIRWLYIGALRRAVSRKEAAMMGMTPTDYIRELHGQIEALIRINEQLRVEIKTLEEQIKQLEKAK